MTEILSMYDRLDHLNEQQLRMFIKFRALITIANKYKEDANKIRESNPALAMKTWRCATNHLAEAVRTKKNRLQLKSASRN